MREWTEQRPKRAGFYAYLAGPDADPCIAELKWDGDVWLEYPARPATEDELRGLLWLDLAPPRGDGSAYMETPDGLVKRIEMPSHPANARLSDKPPALDGPGIPARITLPKERPTAEEAICELADALYEFRHNENAPLDDWIRKWGAP